VDKYKFRYYAEQYALGVMLLADAGRRYDILMGNSFVSHDPSLQTQLNEQVLSHPGLNRVKPYGGSLWVRVRGADQPVS
jgi:hypothetical protein